MEMLANITKSLKINSRACLTGLILTIFSIPVMAGTIAGTKHDFSNSTLYNWNTTGEICVVCHTPHSADTTVSAAPLWNHAVTSKVFTVYSSDTLNASVGQPSGTSKLCLSCHDGSVALDSFGGSTAGTSTMGGTAAIGIDELSNDHPISFNYDQTLIDADGALHSLTKAVTVGTGGDSKAGTIADTMLFGGQVQCASCHDVHNKFTADSKLLRISRAGSALCLTCHNK